MSSSHSPHDLLLLLPLQKSSSCNCQYKLIKYNTNYYNYNNNYNNNNKNINNNYNNNKLENILLWVLVVPLLISTTSTTKLTSTNKTTTNTTAPKQNSFFRIVRQEEKEEVEGKDRAIQQLLNTSFKSLYITKPTALTTTTTRSIDIKQRESLKLLLRTLTGSLILTLISFNLNHLQRLLLRQKVIQFRLFEVLNNNNNNLSKKLLVFDHQIANIPSLIWWWSCSFPVHPLNNKSSSTTNSKKYSSCAAYFLTHLQPEEAFIKSRLLPRTSQPRNLSIKGICLSIHQSQHKTTPHCNHQYYLRFLLQG
ncbi:uncharacterized protein ACRADG_010429 isoform 1-T5 [Cochliomyia hominivorax]